MNPWTPLAGATFGYAVGTVLTRAVLLRGVNTWTLIPIRMVFALVTLLVVMALTNRFWTTDPRAWKRGLVLGVVGMALPMILMTLGFEDLPVSLGGLLTAGIGAVETILAFGSLLTAAGLNPASRLALVGYAIPVLSVILAVIFFAESLTPGVVTGAALILTGVLMAERATSHVPEPGVATVR